jgi:NAD(P)-dependent dehydrogenase (short-subunit alcohol dehydrogenase family)
MACRQLEMRFQPDCGEQSYNGSGKMVGKKAVITGGDFRFVTDPQLIASYPFAVFACSGIGRAIAIAFAREGADVCIGYRTSKADAEETCRIIATTTTSKCMMVQGDVRSQESCKNIIDRAVPELGGITTLVCNAGIQFSEGIKTGEVKALQAMTDGGSSAGPEEAGEALMDASRHLSDVFATNIFSNFYLAGEAAKHFKPDTGCTILLVSSNVSYKGHNDLLSYTASKSAQVGLLRSLSKHKWRLCRVNGIAPGPILSPMICATWGSEKTVSFGLTNPMGRCGQPIDCAPAAVFLSSSDSSFIDGQVIHIDGGATTAS